MRSYTLSEAWSGVNWPDLMAAQGAFGTDFYDRSILRPMHRAYYRSGRPVIKIGPKGALGSHEIRPIHSAPSLGQSIYILFKISLITLIILKRVLIVLIWRQFNLFSTPYNMQICRKMPTVGTVGVY